MRHLLASAAMAAMLGVAAPVMAQPAAGDTPTAVSTTAELAEICLPSTPVSYTHLTLPTKRIV